MSELPAITTIETTARVGEDKDPAVVIWFDNDTALRYRWDGGEICEETYVDGATYDSYPVGGSREELAAYALETISEYVSVYRDDPEVCEQDWPHIYEMLVVDVEGCP